MKEIILKKFEEVFGEVQDEFDEEEEIEID